MIDDLFKADWDQLVSLFSTHFQNHRLTALFYLVVAVHAMVFCTYIWCKALTLFYSLSERLVRFYWAMVWICLKPIVIALMAIALYKSYRLGND